MAELQISGYGGINKLVYSSDNLDVLPSDDEVRVKVLVAGINVIDTKIRQGTSFAAKTRGDRFPWTIGFDMAGEVVKGRHEFHKGDLVAGLVGFPMTGGAYSSENNFKISDLVKIPKGVSVMEAGALPMAGLTAYQALFDVGHLKSGETVVVNGASGGVGHLAVQLAKKAGARVLAICSQPNVDFVKSLGADEVESYEDELYLRWQSEADLVLDLVGGQSGINTLSLLKMKSRMISVPTASYQAVKLAATNLTSEVLGMVVKPNIEELTKLLEMLKNGDLKVHISQSFYLKDGARAHSMMETGSTTGKLVFIPNGILKSVDNK